MSRAVTLLRGINVGGKNPLKMAALKLLFEELGFTRVDTYIQSGNIAFDYEGRASVAKLSLMVHQAIEARFGYDIPVLTRTGKYLARVVASNPLSVQAEADPKSVSVTFLAKKGKAPAVAELVSTTSGSDIFEVHGDVVYLYCPDGYGKTKLNNSFIERTLGVAATTRNWRTTQKVATMALA